MKLFLVRHGETQWNNDMRWQGQTDIALNERGLWQAQFVGKKLSAYSVAKIYTSHLQRAKKTAEIISSMNGASIVVKEDLQEIALGKWQGLTPTQIKEQYGQELVLWEEREGNYPAPEGESHTDFQRRAWNAVCEIAHAENEDTIICTHGAFIQMVVCQILHISFEHRLCFKTHNVGVTIIEYEKDKDQYRLITLNDISHLLNSNYTLGNI